MMLAAVIAVVAAVLGLYVASVYMALRDYSLRTMEEIAARASADGGPGMARVEPIIADASGHVLAMGFLRVLCHVALTVSVCVALGVFQVSGLAEAAVSSGPDPDGAARLTLDLPRLILAFFAASLLVYLFGTVIPMSIAEHAGERLIFASAPFIRAVHILAAPIRAVRVVDVGIRRLVGAHHVTDQQEIEAEILSVVSEGEREGSIGETEREMIESVVEFRQLTAQNVMTPRTEIVGLEMTDDLRAIRDFIKNCGHSRIPVYHADLDHIAGMLYAKDLLRYVAADITGFKLKPLLRPAVFVPEQKRLTDLLHELRARKVHVAIVIDEYGGTTGLVSFEDILEEIVGDIQDEYEPTQPEQPEIIVDPAARSAQLEARAYIEDANEALESLGISLPDDGDYDTVGGYVLDLLGRIPVPGESFTTDRFSVTVLDAETTRIIRLRIDAAAPADESAADAGADVAESRESEVGS